MAFSKSGPLTKLRPLLEAWKQNGKTIEAIFGIDHFGTTQQSLQVALELFDAVYITNTKGSCTFHPKFYLFSGSAKARFFYGSHNLTVGGTETNFEAGICLDLNLPEDQSTYEEAYAGWDMLMPAQFSGTKKLTKELLEQLVAAGIVLDEAQARTVTLIKSSRPKSDEDRLTLPNYGKNPSMREQLAKHPAEGSETLVIQSKQNGDGEVILPQCVVQQNPSFFSLPLDNSELSPQVRMSKLVNYELKRSADIFAEDARGNTIYESLSAPLDIKLRSKRKGLYFAFPAEAHQRIQPYSILAIHQSDSAEPDYTIDIFNPDSKSFSAYLEACNQITSIGKHQSCRFAWL